MCTVRRIRTVDHWYQEPSRYRSQPVRLYGAQSTDDLSIRHQCQSVTSVLLRMCRPIHTSRPIQSADAVSNRSTGGNRSISAHSPRLAVAAQSRTRCLYLNESWYHSTRARVLSHKDISALWHTHLVQNPKPVALLIVNGRESRTPLSSPRRARQQTLTSRHSSRSTCPLPNLR